MNPLIITIDGPAGAGKSTVAKSLAVHLGIPYLSSGELYRAVTWAACKHGVNPDNEKAILDLCKRTKFALFSQNGDQTVLVDGTPLADELRTPHVSMVASEISRHRRVRAFLKPIQRQYGASNGVVAEGRDMGTHVFVDAEIKIFLSASSTIRAQRRFRELQGQDASRSWEATTNELRERDNRDTTRDTAPLRPAPDATLIDTTALSAPQVVDAILEVIRQRQTRPRPDPSPLCDTTKRTLASY